MVDVGRLRANGDRVPGDSPPSPERGYLEQNQLAWDRWARDYTASGRKAWADRELTWGIWNRPESELQLLASLAPGSDVIELGCGTAAICAWLARGGMRPVGVDFSRAQLATAERLQREFDLFFPLIQANAEEVPYDLGSFDVVISEYGASLWCEPARWLAEADRLLRPDGLLVFVTNSALLMACTPADGGLPSNRLVQDYFVDARVEFAEEEAVEFHLGHGEWVRHLQRNGFNLENLLEVRPPTRATPRRPFVSVEWARRWPSEEIWVARKRR